MNVDSEKAAGQSITSIDSINDKPFGTWIFKKSDTVTTFLSNVTVAVGSDAIAIDQALLFQRLLALADRLDVDQKQSIEYELCSFPSAQILHCISGNNIPLHILALLYQRTNVCSSSTVDPFCIGYNGKVGQLLVKLLKKYVEYVTINYPHFDGYSDVASTKDMMHLKR